LSLYLNGVEILGNTAMPGSQAGYWEPAVQLNQFSAKIARTDFPIIDMSLN
jgi:hypothetical protein